MDLNTDDLVNLIRQAQSGTADPINTAFQMFRTIGDDAACSGDVLRQAFSIAGVIPGEPLAAIVAAVHKIAKKGSNVTVSLAREMETNVRGTRIKLQPVITFTAPTENGLPAITDIRGVAVHKFLWLDLKQVAIRQDQEVKIVRVVTSGGTRDFP